MISFNENHSFLHFFFKSSMSVSVLLMTVQVTLKHMHMRIETQTTVTLRQREQGRVQRPSKSCLDASLCIGLHFNSSNETNPPQKNLTSIKNKINSTC